jgi:hypothetical protein
MQTKSRRLVRSWRSARFAVALTALSGGALVLAHAEPAVAQVSDAAKQLARKNYKAGEAKFANGQYAEALELYEQAEATIPVPQTKFKIAACNDKLGRNVEAARWYQLFLDNVPPDKADKLAADIAVARGRIAQLRSGAQAQVRVVFAPTTARVLVSVDGGAPQVVSGQMGLPPGHHQLTFQADGYDPFATTLDVGPSDSKEIRFALQPRRVAGPAVVAVLPPPVVVAPTSTDALPPAVPPPHRRSNVPSYVLFGATGVGIIVGSAFGVIALQNKNSFNAHPTSSEADTTHTHALISDVSFAIAGALGVTGIVLLVTNLPSRQQDSVGRAFFTPYAGPTGAGATAGLSF